MALVWPGSQRQGQSVAVDVSETLEELVEDRKSQRRHGGSAENVDERQAKLLKEMEFRLFSEYYNSSFCHSSSNLRMRSASCCLSSNTDKTDRHRMIEGPKAPKQEHKLQKR